MNRLSRFQLLQAIYQQFWSRWQCDYLSSALITNQMEEYDTRSTCSGYNGRSKRRKLATWWKLDRIVEMPIQERIMAFHQAFIRPLSKTCLLPVKNPRSTKDESIQQILSPDRKQEIHSWFGWTVQGGRYVRLHLWLMRCKQTFGRKTPCYSFRFHGQRMVNTLNKE